MSRLAASLLLASPSGAALMLVASAAFAQANPMPPPPTERIVMRLDYTGVPGCTDPEPFVLALLPRVHGWVPLADDGPFRLVITVKRRRGYEGVAVLYDREGVAAWTVKYVAKPTCDILLDTLAFGVGFRIDPPDAPPAAPVPVRTATPALAVPECAKPPADEPLEPLPPPLGPPFVTRTLPEPRTVLIFRWGAAVWTGQITTDRGAFGLSLDAGVRYGLFSVSIEGRGDPPLGATPVSGGLNANYARITGALLLCARYGWFVGCAKSEVSRFLVSGIAEPSSTGYGAAGVRLALEFPALPPHVFLRVAGEVLGAIDPVLVTFEKRTVFQVAGTTTGLAVGVLWEVGKP